MTTETKPAAAIPPVALILSAILTLSTLPITPAAEAAEARTAGTPAAAAPADSTPQPPQPTIIVYERPTAEPMSAEEIERTVWARPDNVHPIFTRSDQEGKTLTLDFVPTYDRVNEVAFRFRQTFEHRGKAYPRLRLEEAFSSGRERWLYRLEFEQPLPPSDHLALAAEFFNETAVFTDLAGRVGDTENSLAAIFFREDFRHYLAREGLSLGIRARLGVGPRAEITYTDADNRSLGLSTNGSLFSARETFRDNVAAAVGRLRSWRLGLAYETAERRLRPGLHHRHWLSYEVAGRRAGGSFRYERLAAEVRFRARLAPDQELVLRVKAGRVVSGRLPVQKRFYLGGAGTLRAHEFAELDGSRLYLANIEYGFDLMAGVQAVLFQDLGATWDQPMRLGDTRPLLDTGFALRNRTGRFRINFARDVRRDQAPLVISLRLSEPL